MNAIFAFLVWLWSLLTYLPRRLLATLAPRRETIFRPVHVEDFRTPCLQDRFTSPVKAKTSGLRPCSALVAVAR